ncbi:hypothetical protein H709_00121 [Bartonella bacilliformis CUSCO5]|nr:hypothetical protein X470_00032 [Bartonella bacilliformis Peru-18]KEG18478.1 hypothetical protein H709_00121 [Bartonella bacilliformis CUSCO5]
MLKATFCLKALRKKTLMNNEITQKNNVLTEKHENGRFEGFRFYTHPSATQQSQSEQEHNPVSDEDLVLAFSQRATRFCASANGDFTISSDGIVRWIGQTVGKFAPTEDILKPKVILLADTQLNGENRDKVFARLERFVIFHFESTLKPLFDLRNAETLTDSTRDIATQLANSLGILPRWKVAERVKNLDQQSRAVLRQFGVRFGAFHIYVTAILKPAPVQAMALLWTLKNDIRDPIGFSEILAALAAGRTSLVVDPTYNPRLYALAGYKILKQRAVRIDILERLASLIRLALKWKPGTGPRPEGAYDGKSFFVTPTMMSILGANGTDMEEILQGLSYQSYPCSPDMLEKVLSSSDNAPLTTQSCPEAEFVGDQWQIIEISDTPQNNEKNADKPSCAVEALPEAEPVGNFAHYKHTAESNKVILLWRYNHQRTHHAQNNHNKFGQKRQDQYKKAFKIKSNTTDKIFHKDASHPQKDAFSIHKDASHKKRSYENNNFQGDFSKKKLSHGRNHPDPDSPFAKLAVLRNQLTSNKKANNAPFFKDD